MRWQTVLMVNRRLGGGKHFLFCLTFCVLVCVILFQLQLNYLYRSTMASQVNSESCLQYDDCGRLGDSDADFVNIDFTDKSKSLYADYRHAAHGMIFARTEKILWNSFKMKGCVLMQMRFDGTLGFPGGLVEKGEDPVFGLNREMEEEIGLEVDKHAFTEADHLMSTLHDKKKLMLHFYTKEVSEEEFRALEKKHLSAEEYGIEVQGVIRVPLYTMHDGVRGLPAFLANQFTGNARDQLLLGLEHKQLLTREELKVAVQSCQRHMVQSRNKAKAD